MLLLQNCLFPLYLGLGLLAPGWLLGRALGTSGGITGSFLGSAAILLNLLLLLDSLNVALTVEHVAAGLAMICALLAFIAKRRSDPATTIAPDGLRQESGKDWRWLILPVGIGLLSIVLKAAFDPLSSADTKFRWNFLALQMLQQKTLHFYPAFTADDFLHYGWCDGIAPLISSLYFWTYSSLGRPEAWSTAPVVIGQAALLFYVVYKLAAHRQGTLTGWCAVAVLSSSHILLSGVAIGQETGLTALSLVTMLLFLEYYQDTRTSGWLIWAGIAAGVGGLAREYGLIFSAFGCLCLIEMRPRFRDWAMFLGATLVIAAPAYVRNGIKTGNPLYSHSLAGVFPVNPIHTEYMQTVHASLSITQDPAQLPIIGMLLLAFGGVPFILGLTGGIKNFRRCWPWCFAATVVFAIWLWSIGQTSGGRIYSMRVLTPTLAVGAVLGGQLLGSFWGSRRASLLALFLVIPALDAAARTFLAPYYYPVSWWKESPLAWITIRERIDSWDHHSNWSLIADAAENRRILVTDPFTHAIFVRLGANPISYFSPSVRFLFEPEANFAACCDHLRNDGVRFILVPPPEFNGFNSQQLLRHPFFIKLESMAPVKSTPSYFAYDLYSPSLMEGAHTREPNKPAL